LHTDAKIGKDEGRNEQNHNTRIALVLAGCMMLVLAGCRAPGKPGAAEPRPDQVMDFAKLYKQNCAACHGENGKRGLAVSLSNPVYIAIAGKEAIRNATAKGGPGKLMPAFAKSYGGADRCAN
jgi:mono/diheme cytochrome c family protein